jgi:outer membrane protein assembly factor BamB
MALILSLILFISSLYTLGLATPYLDFSLGLGRNGDLGNSGGARIGTERRSAVSLTRRSRSFGSISTTGADEDELLDVVLLATIDGKFHALNRTDGTILWSMHNSFTTDCAVGEEEKTLSPLIRTPHMLHPIWPEESETLEDEEIYIVEPQSGSIYVLPSHATHSNPLSKLSFTVPQLVEMSPVTLPGKTFVGRKETSLIAIDLDTGVVKGVVDTDRECLWEPVLGNNGERDDVDLDELEDDPKAGRKHEIYVGRTGMIICFSNARAVTHDSCRLYRANTLQAFALSGWTEEKKEASYSNTRIFILRS